MTKLCKDCKHSKNIIVRYCEHPNVGYNLVDGDVNAKSCLLARYDNLCGVEARWFEPKPQRLQRFLQFFQPAPNL